MQASLVWSGKHCAVTKFEDGLPLEWGKPLRKVFWTYPAFNQSNTVLIDHKVCRLGGNKAENLIVPTPFYVADLERVGDDKAFLKACLWPQLKQLNECMDIAEFRRFYPECEVVPGLKILRVSPTPSTPTSTDTVDGEGTCEPSGST
jgi:hypothetical protein